MKKYDEYKDSGVAWIGEVPKHWEILRGKYVLKILSGFPFDSQKFEFEDNGVYMPLIRIRDINGSSTEVYYSGSYPIESVVKTGEVLIGMDGDFIYQNGKVQTLYLISEFVNYVRIHL